MIGQPTGQSLLLIDPILKSGASKREFRTLAWRPSAIKSHHGGNVCIYGSSMVLHLLHGLPNKYRRDDCANYQLDNFLQTKIRQATSKVLLNVTEKVSHIRTGKSP